MYVDYSRIIAYAARGAAHTVRISGGKLLDLCDEFRTVTVEGHHIGELRTEALADGHFAASGLVEHRHAHSVPEAALPVHRHHAHVLYEAPVAYLVIGDVVVHVADQTAVSQTYIVEAGILYTGLAAHSARQFEDMPEGTQAYLSAEVHVPYAAGIEALCHFHLIPVLRGAGRGLEQSDFLCAEFSIFLHSSLSSSIFLNSPALRIIIPRSRFSPSSSAGPR